jgi:hypothetical protein
MNMKTLPYIASCMAGLTLAAGTASAQISRNYCGYTGGYGYHSSTFEEGVQRGYASVISAQGQANYLNGQAAVYFQEARNRAIQNDELATTTYFRTRQVNQEARNAGRPARLSTDRYASIAKAAAPGRLSNQEYDTTFARLNWPAAFAGNEFTADREAMDRAFGSRSLRDRGADSAFYGEVRQLSNSMQKTLKTKAGELDAAQYVAAKRFLMSLTYEASQPMVVQTVALR